MPSTGKKYALLVGNHSYRDFPELTVPAADVDGLKAVLEDPSIGAFDQARALRNPDLAAAQLAVGELCAERRPDDLILLYFSGHGEKDWPSGSLYFALPDTRRDLLRHTALSSAFVVGELERSRAGRQLLILDCCYSGAIGHKGAAVDAETFGGTGQPVATAPEGPAPSTDSAGYGRVTLTSSDDSQPSWEGNRIIAGVERSLFTHFLIEGLATGAAAAAGEATVGDHRLFQYVRHQVETATAAAGRPMTPLRFVHAQRGGELILAKNPAWRPDPRDLLPADLVAALEDPDRLRRLGAVRELGRCLGDPAQAEAARALLERRLPLEENRFVYEAMLEVLGAPGSRAFSPAAEALTAIFPHPVTSRGLSPERSSGGTSAGLDARPSTRGHKAAHDQGRRSPHSSNNSDVMVDAPKSSEKVAVPAGDFYAEFDWWRPSLRFDGLCFRLAQDL